jgi:RNA 2',3'-cyclic 3'-phosphodiesterase
VIRSFIAVDVDPNVIASISRVIADLTPIIPAMRWVPATNFHLTIKFLGDIQENSVYPIAAVLEEKLRLFPRFSINAKGLGVFPDLRRPRILWVGLTASPLLNLAARVESALQPLGFLAEKRPFTPHLTIGRWRQFDRPPQALSEAWARWRDFEFGDSTIDKVVLYQSVLRPAGATYQILKIVSLDKRCDE